MLLKFLMISAIIFYVFYKFSGQILRFVAKKAGQKLEKEMRKKAEEAMKNAQTQAQNPEQTVRNQEGENITVSYVKEPKRHAKKNFTDGDYIDFEEVK